MIKTISDEYVYKKEVDWSLFNYGFAIPIEHQVVFSQAARRFIHDVDPVFDRGRLLYIYSNGFEEKLVLNQHL